MIINNNDIILNLLIQKLINSGKKNKALCIHNNFNLLLKKTLCKNNILQQAVFNLIVPINFKSKKIGFVKYQIPYIIHYYKSINLALT